MTILNKHLKRITFLKRFFPNEESPRIPRALPICKQITYEITYTSRSDAPEEYISVIAKDEATARIVAMNFLHGRFKFGWCIKHIIAEEEKGICNALEHNRIIRNTEHLKLSPLYTKVIFDKGDIIFCKS